MQNPIMSMLLNQLQARNPNAFNLINQARNGGTDPQNMLKQFINNSNPQQMQQILNQAKNIGVPDNILNQIQNMR